MAEDLPNNMEVDPGCGDETEDDGDFYVMYKDRSEWSDVQPIGQDEGEEPVVQIDYSAKFSDVYDYFRGVLKKGEKSQRILNLTSDAIMLNAANYTVWQYRRDVLEALGVPSIITENGVGEQFEKEFEFSRQMIEENQKNYQVWHHRKMLVSWAAGYQEDTDTITLESEALRRKLAQVELDLTEKVLCKDAKNYHAWQHRQWALSTFNIFESELAYVTELIEDDVRNNSAWNERYFVLSNSVGVTEKDLENDIEFTWVRILRAPSNESPWNFLRGLFLLFKKLGDESAVIKVKQRVLDRCVEHYKSGLKSIPLLGFIIELALDRLTSRTCPVDLYTFALTTCDNLLESDPIRVNYWKYQKKEMDNLYQLQEKQKAG